MGPLELHVQSLLRRIADATVRDVPGTGTLVTLPVMPLHGGWNKQTTAVHFIAPQGYPFARPDSFWADDDLRLASGSLPQNVNCGMAIPGLNKSALWFSWHLQQWNANRDNLLTWVASIKDRLARAV